jgi:hypothetical protein
MLSRRCAHNMDLHAPRTSLKHNEWMHKAQLISML